MPDTALEPLRERLRELGSVVVAFSGGADSAFLAWVSHDTLGPDRALAVTAVSPSLPVAEREECAALVDRAAQVLPATAWGVRASGDPDRSVRRLAVCGGSGDSMLSSAAASGADAFLTSDLRHHPASEAPEGLALIDAAHWATEWPWLPVAAARFTEQIGLDPRVSRLVTDPFRLSSRSPYA